MEKYPERVIVRLTLQQKTLLDELAKLNNKTVSQMLRMLIQDGF